MISGKNIPYKPLADAVDEQWKKYVEEKINLIDNTILPNFSSAGIDIDEFNQKLKKAKEFYEAGDYAQAGNLCSELTAKP